MSKTGAWEALPDVSLDSATSSEAACLTVSGGQLHLIVRRDSDRAILLRRSMDGSRWSDPEIVAVSSGRNPVAAEVAEKLFLGWNNDNRACFHVRPADGADEGPPVKAS